MTSVLLDPEMYAAEAQQILTYDLHDGCGIDLAVYTEPPPESGPYSPRERTGSLSACLREDPEAVLAAQRNR